LEGGVFSTGDTRVIHVRIKLTYIDSTKRCPLLLSLLYPLNERFCSFTPLKALYDTSYVIYFQISLQYPEKGPDKALLHVSHINGKRVLSRTPPTSKICAA